MWRRERKPKSHTYTNTTRCNTHAHSRRGARNIRLFRHFCSSTTGYRLNPDGTLALLPGSPFAINGGLAAAGNFLAVSSGGTVSTFLVDPASGALTKAGS